MSESTTEQTAQQTPPGITVGDLVLSAQIVQRSATAGVFRAEELKAVGEYYDRLIKFLESTGALQRAPSPEQTAGQGETK